MSSKSEVFEFSGGQKPPIRGVTFDLWCPFSNLDELFQSKVMCENLVRIGWNRRYVNFRGGKKPPIRGLHVTCDAHFRTWPSYFSQKSCVKIWFRLVEPFKSYRGNIKKKKKIPGCRNPLLGELHLPCDAHFRTRMSYSSQKSYVRIWFGLVEIGGMLIFRWGRQKPLIRLVTCDLRCPRSNTAELFQSKVVWKFGSNWLSFSRVIVVTSPKNKIFKNTPPPQVRGVTFDLWYPFSNLADLFQSKVMCENLVWIGWNRRYVNF